VVLLVALSLIAVVATLSASERSDPPRLTMAAADAAAPATGAGSSSGGGSTPPRWWPRAGQLGTAGRYPGILYPAANRVAVYHQLAAGGTERALVRTLRSDRMSLGLSCPGGRRVDVGASRLDLRVPAGSGVCTVTVSAVAAASPGEPFVLTVEHLRR
jgi:hypothetical protein